MTFRSTVLVLLAGVVAATALFLWRRQRPRDEFARERGVVLPPAEAPSVPSSPLPIAPPALAEVRRTLDRVFHRNLAVDPAAEPAFLAGDFNGDDVLDLTAVVRPQGDGALASLNASPPAWRTQDALAHDVAGRPPPVKVEGRDLLLAVVHGVGAEGWRDPMALQGYLLKNAVRSGLRVRPLTGVPDTIRMKAIRVHKGDVIVGTRDGHPGVVFWTGAAYTWADLNAPHPAGPQP